MDNTNTTWQSFGVKAGAHWAGMRSLIPVSGEAWFLVSQAGLASCGMGLEQLMVHAKAVYPTMHEVVERMSIQSNSACLSLRQLEVYEDDISNTGLGDVRKTLEKRSQICGMRIAACINACAGFTVVHGMPLQDHPSKLRDFALLSMIEELDLAMESKESVLIDALAKSGRL